MLRKAALARSGRGPQEGATHADGRICAKIRVQATLGVEGEIAPLMTAMRQVGVDSQGRAEALAIFHPLIFTRTGYTDSKHPARRPSENSQEHTTRDMLRKKAVAWRISGAWMMVTSCATQRWSSYPAAFDAANARFWCGLESTKNRIPSLRQNCTDGSRHTHFFFFEKKKFGIILRLHLHRGRLETKNRCNK